jgi:iron complex outermembrane receptor protein
VSARFEPHKRLVVRAAASTGFRAPSLAQSNFSTVSTNFINVGGQVVPVEVGTFAVNSEIARALGAQDLEPEQSVNLSGGLAVEPAKDLTVTLDAYVIDIDDRIVFSGNFTGGRIAPILAPFNASGARFFTNAIDTRTKGVDVTATWRTGLGRAGDLTLQAAHTRNDTNIEGTVTTPALLAGLENVLFDREQTLRVTCGQPEDNTRLTATLTRNRITGVLRGSRYGEYCFATNVAANDQTFSARWIADLELTWQGRHIVAGVGAQNLFDEFPDRLLPANSSFQVLTYPNTSPFGFNGRFVYLRLTYRF